LPFKNNPGKDAVTGLKKHNKQGMRVLLIDDNEDVMASITLWLDILGYQVMTANTGAQSILIAQSFEPDVILLDIGLPDMDGYQVVKKLREQSTKKQPLIIGLSGYPQCASHPCCEEGFNHYLMKPAKFSEIQGLILKYQHATKND